MRFPIKTTAVLVVFGGIAAASYAPAKQYFKDRYRVQYQEEEVSTGPVVFEVNSTGTVQPVISYHVGSFVPGPIVELNVEFNQPVKKGELLAKVDPLIYKANLDRDHAALVRCRADVDLSKALVDTAKNDLGRAQTLRKQRNIFVTAPGMAELKC